MENQFKVLGLPESFNLNPADLEEQYLKACRASHPDLHQSFTDSMVLAAENSLALVNTAYETLGNPLTRAEHLLFLSGGPSSKECKVVDPEFLEEMIAIREKLALSTTIGERESLSSHITGIKLNAFSKLKIRLDVPISRDNHLDIRMLLNQIAFIESLERSVAIQEN